MCNKQTAMRFAFGQPNPTNGSQDLLCATCVQETLGEDCWPDPGTTAEEIVNAIQEDDEILNPCKGCGSRWTKTCEYCETP